MRLLEARQETRTFLQLREMVRSLQHALRAGNKEDQAASA
jgi:hypothetical protein